MANDNVVDITNKEEVDTDKLLESMEKELELSTRMVPVPEKLGSHMTGGIKLYREELPLEMLLSPEFYDLCRTFVEAKRSMVKAVRSMTETFPSLDKKCIFVGVRQMSKVINREKDNGK